MSGRGAGRVAGVALTLCAGLCVAAQSPNGLAARTLDGVDLSVPRDLPPGALLVVGFSRASNDQTQPWREALDAADRVPPTYSVLVLAGAPRFVRGLIARAARRAVPDEDHHSVLIVAENGDGWRALVDFEPDAEDAAYVVRVDGLGGRCFRHVGPVTDATIRAAQDAACVPGGADGGSANASGRTR